MHLVADALRQPGDHAGRQSVDQSHELLAAQPRHDPARRCGRGHLRQDRIGDALQHHVAVVVAETVVDVLELVDVDHHRGQRGADNGLALDDGAGEFEEGAPVGQIGQRIDVRLALEFGVQLALAAHGQKQRIEERWNTG